tara:strand:+ start:23999 stop:24193 length:195 start_codon:yes stop_codon:yes gene_type:complete
MENENDYILLTKVINEKKNRIILKHLLAGAAVGVGAAISFILFLNMIVSFDWLSKEIINIISGL